MSVTKYMKFGVYSSGSEEAPQQQNQDFLQAKDLLNGLDVAIFDDSGHPKNEQAKTYLAFEVEIDKLFAESRYAEVRALIEGMIQSIDGVAGPVQERKDCVLRAFWDADEVAAYKRTHPILPKPVLWMAPSVSELWQRMAATFHREGRHDHALLYLLSAKECEPDHPRIWVAEGRTMNWQDRFADALSAYRTGASIRAWTPPSVVSQCFYGQGVALSGLRRLKEAKEAFERALKLNPENDSARQDLSWVSFDLLQQQKREAGIRTPTYLT